MTEAEWLAGSFPWPLLEHIRENLLSSERKARLVAVGCCRRVWKWLEDERSRTAVDVAELYADGLASPEELASARAGAEAVRDAFHAYQTTALLLSSAAVWVTYASGIVAAERAGGEILGTTGSNELQSRLTYTAIIRDIFGNPFRPVAFSPSWRTDTAVALARQMYDSREFGAMPILADALQDAGCDSEDILSHCRGEGPHVRGCWVVDLVFGKE